MMTCFRLYKKSVQDLISYRTIYFMLIDMATIFALFLSVALALYIISKPYHHLTSTLGPLASLTMSSVQMQEQIASNISTFSALLSNFLESIIRGTIIFILFFSAIIGISNQTVWSLIPDRRFKIDQFWSYFTISLLLLTFWLTLMVISIWLLKFKAAMIMIFLCLLIGLHSFQALYANIPKNKRTIHSIHTALRRSIKVYVFAGIILMPLTLWLVLSIGALVLQGAPIIYAFMLYLVLLVYSSWVRHYFNRASEVRV
jgi:hypothetical protein